MANRVNAQNLGAAINSELTLYHEDVTSAIDKLSADAVKELVKITRATAPVGHRGTYKKNIAGKQATKSKNGSTYVWYVKAPDYRLTHLLVHGHATRNGGRTHADPFLRNAVAQVLPSYEERVKEALRNGR